MIIALLMIESGMEYTKAVNQSISIAKLRSHAIPAELAANVKRASDALFKISGSFSLESSRSSAASSSMKINPTVPKSSSATASNGISSIPIAVIICLSAIPIAIKTSTDGTFVFLAKTFAK